MSSDTAIAAILATIARLNAHDHFLLKGVDPSSVAWTPTNTQGNAHRELTHLSTTDNQRVRTVFTIIGRISSAGGLGPNGEFEMFNRDLTEGRFAKGFYVGQLVRPLDTDIAGDVNLAEMWDQHVVPFFDHVQASSRPADEASWILHPVLGEKGLRFKQRMFEVGSPTGATSFETWPFNTACRKIVVDNPGLRTNHKIIPLKAWDADVDAIEPGRAKFVLDGALVEIHFTLENWNIGPTVRDGQVTKPGSSSISAHFDCIDVIDVKPRTVRGPSSPMKKRKANVDAGGSPTKKHNTSTV